MKRNKWQGVACLLLSSLMVATPMVTTTATEKPAETTKEATKDTAKDTTKDTAKDATKDTTKGATTDTKSTTPGENTKPATPSTTPGENTKPATPSTTPGENTKPATPSTTPGENTKPATPSTTPGQNTKPAVPSTTPGENTKPTTPPTTTAPNTKPTTPSDTTTQKPFTLDHFKMIVETLKKLGVDEDEIVNYIKDGKKLEDILKAEKIKPKKFKKAMIKEYNNAVDEAVEKGQITSEQAKQLKTAIKETVKNWLPNK